VKANTWPTIGAIEYHNGQSWETIPVGPTKPDRELTYNSSAFPIYTQSSVVTNSGPNGSYVTVAVPAGFRDLTFRFGGSNGTLWIAACEATSMTWTVTKSSTTSGSSQYTETPPSYIQWEGGSEGGAPVVDNGNLPDLDNDGIPDVEDDDDDGDGRPDEDDAFPRNPNEKDDTDGDGQGNNADEDDDGDGRPDVDDDHPTDPTRQDQDTDADGTRDKDDKFPTNPREWADSDNDGVGDNIDPDDNSPPEEGGQGDGEGNPGTGDGGGGPGPTPKPGDTGTDTGDTGTGDTSGTIKPSQAVKDMPAQGAGIAPALGDKLGQFKPLGVSSIGKVSVISSQIDTVYFGVHEIKMDFNQTPWPGIRMVLLACVIYLVGRSAVETLKV
jgi:hypothetical protein